MKVAILSKDLAKICSLASRFVSNRAQLPILGNIILKAQGNSLIVMSTNLEISLVAKIGAKVGEEGELGVPARTLTDIVSNLGSGTVTLESKEEQLSIVADNFEGRVSGINTADFPKLPEGISQGVKINAKELALGLSRVSFSVSLEEIRPILTGVLFLFSGSKLTLVSSDGFRLSKYELNLKEEVPELQVVIPKLGVTEIAKLASEELGDVLMHIQNENNQVIVSVGDVVFSTRILEGEFPNFEKIIPTSSSLKVSLDKEDFARSIKLSAVFARESSNISKIKILERGIEVSAESAKSGKQKTQVEAKVDGFVEDFEITFNYRFLEEFTNVLDGEILEIGFNENTSPGVFHDLKHPNFLHLVMPVKVQG